VKLNIIAALLLCASVASAQTDASATTTTTAPAKTAAPTKKASKKAKKKDSAKVTPEEVKAVEASATQSTPAELANAPAAATSTAAAPAAAAPTKKWGATLYVEPFMNYAGGKDVANAPVSTVSYLGASYKVTATEKVGVRQYFNHAYDPNAAKNFETSDLQQSFTVATVSTKTKGIFGSDDISPMFWYYLPGHTAEETNFGKDMDNFYGILRADVEVAWTLNPKWSVSYYANPRQTLGAEDTEAKFEATSRLVHYANVYYNISDSAQIYGNVGFDNRMSTSKATSLRDDYLSAVGLYMTFFGGKLAINPEISVTTNLKKNGVAAQDQELYKKENIGYIIGTAISL
jgi:hypothetical protein